MRVFVIHARRTGYGVIKALSKYVDEIYLADSAIRPVFKSKFVKKSYILSHITSVSADEFLKELINVAHENNFESEPPVVFTGKDDYLLFFSQYYNQLKKYYRLSFETDYSILTSCLSKNKLVELANISNVLIPKSLTSNIDFEKIVQDLRFPVIIKPDFKNTPEQDVVEQAFRLRICAVEDELRDAMHILSDLNMEFVVQEYIPGGDDKLYTFGVYSYKGEIKAWSTSKKIRQFPPDTGQCSFGKTIYIEDLYETGKSLLRNSGLTGISQIEFKEYKGQYYLIEINPRIWAWHEIHTKVGVNFSKVAMDHMYGNVYDKVIHPSKDEKYWMFVMMDLLHNNILNKNVSKMRLIKDLLKSDVEAFFCWKDLSVSIDHTLKSLRYIKSERKKQKGLS